MNININVDLNEFLLLRYVLLQKKGRIERGRDDEIEDLEKN